MKVMLAEEVLRLREELMGTEYRDFVGMALVVRFAKNPRKRIQAAALFRHELFASSKERSITVTESLAELTDVATA